MSGTSAGRFCGKVAVITGSANGIGSATAQRLAAEGAIVFLWDIDDIAGSQVAEAIQQAGGQSSYAHVDVSDEDSVGNGIASVIDSLGRLDIMHANAAIEWTKPIHQTSLAEWDRVIGINLTGVYLSCRHALLHMMSRQQGNIVITSSPHAVRTTSDAGAYATAKGGSVALMRALALEAAPFSVRVNAVLPGAIDTPMLRREALVADDPEEQLRRFAAVPALGRLGNAAEIAEAVLFLASDAASFVTGTSLWVDGGADASLSSGPRSYA